MNRSLTQNSGHTRGATNANSSQDNFVPSIYEVDYWGHTAACDNAYVELTTEGIEGVPGSDICPNLILGRLPVTSTAEIADYREKLLEYEFARSCESNQEFNGDWHKDVLFVAGDLDRTPLLPTPERVSGSIDNLVENYIPPDFNSLKMSHSDYDSDVERKSAICSAIDAGKLMLIGQSTGANGLNYCNILYRSGEAAFDAGADLLPSQRYPLVVGASCHIGQSDEVAPVRSLAENLLFQNDRGAIALIGPSGSSAQSANEYFCERFLEIYREHPDWSIGHILVAEKHSAARSPVEANLMETHRLYTLYGDPSLVLYGSSVVPQGGSFSSGFEIDDELALQLTQHQHVHGFILFDTSRVIQASSASGSMDGARFYQVVGLDDTPYPHSSFWTIYDVSLPLDENHRFLSYYSLVSQHPSGVARVALNGLLASGALLSEANADSYVVDQYGDRLGAAYRTQPIDPEHASFYGFDLSIHEGDTLVKVLVEYADPDGTYDDHWFKGAFDQLSIGPNWGSPPIVSSINIPSSISTNGTTSASIFAEDRDRQMRGDTLSYEWVAERGNFVGVGPEVTYQAPSIAQDDVTITCRVTDLGGNVVESTSVIDVVEQQPQGCPVFYVDAGYSMVFENVILTASEDPDSAGLTVTDNCPLRSVPPKDEGILRIRIAEEEDEISYIDQVELIAVPYHLLPGEELAMKQDGELLAISESIAPIYVACEGGHQSVNALMFQDGDVFEHYGAGVITLVYPNVDSILGLSSRFRSRGSTPGGGVADLPPNKNLYKYASTHGPSEDDSEGNILTITLLNGHDGPIEVGRVYPRINRTIPILTDMTDAVRGISHPVIEVSWTRFLRTDQIGFRGYRSFSRSASALPLVQARNGIGESIYERIVSRDNDEFILKPGEVAQLQFSRPANLKTGEDVQYILKTTGHYESCGRSTITSIEELEGPVAVQNRPNPFNCETEIHLDIRRAGVLRVEVFNVLGRRVGVVFDEYVEAGALTIPWAATNSHGTPLSTGVYWCRVTVDGYSETQKMLLIK